MTETLQQKIDNLYDNESCMHEHLKKDLDKALQEFREQIIDSPYSHEVRDYFLALIGEKSN